MKTSTHKFIFSIGRVFNSKPQPGQKSSLVMNSLGKLAGFFFFVVGSALAVMISFSSLISCRSNRMPVSVF